MEDKAENSKIQNIQEIQKAQKIRFGLLVILVSSSLLILVRSLIDSNIGKPTPFSFPKQIELAFKSSQSKNQIKNQVKTQQSATIIDNKDFFGKPKYLSGESYKYLLDDLPIDIDLRYAIGTDGDVPLFMKELGNIDIGEDQLRQKIAPKDAIGYHVTFTHQNRAYLTACINPRGISTVTKEQFEDNASDRATDRDVVIGWLLGQKDLRDRRCLWTLISTPITSENDLNVTNQKLEKIWISWYEWWKPQFPQL